MSEGKCKECDEKYCYIGLDFGLCIKCIDKLEVRNSKLKGKRKC